MQVPASTADPNTGDFVFSAVLHSARLRYIDRPITIISTYSPSSPGVAMYTRTEIRLFDSAAG